MRIYSETPLRLAPPRMALAIPAETSTASMLKTQRREFDRDLQRMRAGIERHILRPMWFMVRDAHLDEEAAKSRRPALGKALSRRARRRNRGRIRQARIEMAQQWAMPNLWSWHLARAEAP